MDLDGHDGCGGNGSCVLGGVGVRAGTAAGTDADANGECGSGGGGEGGESRAESSGKKIKVKKRL